jgi:putative peptidoglycan lipid II flippase
VAPECHIHWREILARPSFFVLYAAGLGFNITFTRAYATQAGPGMAAALDYCMRGVGVPLAILVNPISNSLLPEIARLRSLFRLRDAFRLIDRTTALAALVAVGACSFALYFREPAIALFFQRGSFTHDSTEMVSAVFLSLGPSLVGWSLIEIFARSLFALDRPWPPVIAALIPGAVNVTLTLWLHSYEPRLIGLGASVGLLTGFAVLFTMAHASRRRWLAQG